ncbi:MAG TPA: GNAT family N-acetyltransferase [Woeseiaceae bacterium]|nr:GNAT family N-acetyltransferase [Woeseiaceae bacterium]
MEKSFSEGAAQLKTDRLDLYWLTLDDAGLMLTVWNDPAFIQFVGDRGVRTIEDATNALKAGAFRLYERCGYGPYRVTLRATGETLGICGLFRRDNLDDPDIGFSLLPDFRGQGYASEAAMAVCTHAREHLSMPRLIALVAPENTASIGLIRKLGMHFERMITMPGEDKDVCLYGVDWN